MTGLDTLKCYTIGHSDKRLEEFSQHLKEHEIDLVVDVRSFPYPANLPRFDRTRLDAFLHQRGISYVWMGRFLGSLTVDGRLDSVAREDEKSYHEGISELMDLLPGRRVCLLSSESDWTASHRHSLIAQTLMRYGIEVYHITGDGSLIEAPQDLFHLIG